MKDCLVSIEKVRGMTYYGYGDKSDEEKLEKLLEEISKAIFREAEWANILYLELPKIGWYIFEEPIWKKAEEYLVSKSYTVSFKGTSFIIRW